MSDDLKKKLTNMSVRDKVSLHSPGQPWTYHVYPRWIHGLSISDSQISIFKLYKTEMGDVKIVS